MRICTFRYFIVTGNTFCSAFRQSLPIYGPVFWSQSVGKSVYKDSFYSCGILKNVESKTSSLPRRLVSAKRSKEKASPKVSENDQEIPQSHCRPTHGTVRKSHRTFIVTIHLQDNISKATSFVFLFKMIGKLEWT